MSGIQKKKSSRIYIFATVLAMLVLLSFLILRIPSLQTEAAATTGAPTLNAASTGATQIELNWVTVTGAVSYELMAWWEGAISWQPIYTGSSTVNSYIHEELNPGRTYHYIVAAVDANGVRGEWSEHVSETVPGSSASLAAPVLTAASTVTTTVELNWTLVTGAVSYELMAWWEGATSWQPIYTGISTSTSYTHDELTPGRTFYYIIAAVDANGVRSEWSEKVSETVPGSSAGLAAPLLTAVSPVTTTVELNWTSVTDAVSYDLRAWWGGAPGWERIDDGSLTGTSYTHDDRTAGRTYFYIIAAVDTDGEPGTWSQQVKVTVPEPAVIPDDLQERAALFALYNATDGVGWTHSDNWMTDASIATWYGVTTDENGRVVELILASNGLSGSLPDLSALTNLKTLSLSSNQLTGSIPDLGALTNLEELFLTSNLLTGPIQNLSSLANLTSLDLGSNQLTGTIQGLSALTNLETLSLGSNQLTGSFPDLSALTNLSSLSLGSNQLTGPLPDLGALTNLTELYLTDNQLSGSIPDLSILTNLNELYLGSNNFTGSFPELGALSELTWLDLSHNQLTGTIGDLSNLTRLKWLSLNDNQLTGSTLLLSALTNLTWLDLSRNQLTGSIRELSKLTELTTLSLDTNLLTGSIPELSALTDLTSLSLGSNQLTGSIPDLSALTKLTNLDLGSNQLTGSIPDLSEFTNLTSLTLGSNQLAGPMPDLSALTKLTSLDLSANQQLCLPGGYSFSGLAGTVTAHLQSLNLPTCDAL